MPRKLLVLVALLAALSAAPAARAAAPAGAIVDGPADPLGTVILVHASAWQGRYDDPYYHDAKREIYEFIGHQLADRGWRVVSIEYAAGEAGLGDVEAAARTELEDRPDKPLCLYGESSGGHLSLLAAADIPQIGCVVAVGAPTDLTTWQPQATQSGLLPNVLGTIASVTQKVFGTVEDTLRSWSPAYRARQTAADVLLAHETDDWIVPAAQVASFTDRQPTARALSIEGTEPKSDGSIERVHGWWSAAAREQLIGAVASTLDREAAAFPVAQRARATGCADATTPALTLSAARLDASAACLARSIRRGAHLPGRVTGSGAAIGGAARRRTAAVSLTGNVTPARAVWGLLATRAGRAALRARDARRLHLTISFGPRSRARLQVR